MKNLNEFKALIERYESITEDEINKKDVELEYCSAFEIANELTGYGSTHTCILCTRVGFSRNSYRPNCVDCVYGLSKESDHYGCSLDQTYYAIENAEDTAELLTAFRERAKYMRTLLPKE